MPKKHRHARRVLRTLTGMLLAGSALASPVYAGPSGGVVTQGGADIVGQGSDAVTINQNTNRVIIDWQNFDTQSHESVTFNQLDSSSVALNRILSGSPTQFDGSLSANGTVIIMNSNGVVFGNSARVDVNGLIATTVDVNAHSFMNDAQIVFDQSSNPSGAVINHGTITARDAGLVGFVAPHVENSGVITAHMGKVQLASGDRFTFDLYGDGLVSIAASEELTQQIAKNTGHISADGGLVQLQAAAAANLVDGLVINSGTMQARSVEEKNGVIILGGSKTRTEVSGTLDASGKDTNQTGGRIEVTGKDIQIHNATIDASGTNGGGDIRIGGGYKGGEDIHRADTTIVDSDTTITADATENGNGGRIVVWSDDLTDIAGTLSAKGGSQSGDGGLIETSGKTNLRMVGSVDASAVNGDFGTWLVDPVDITITGVAGASDGVNTFNVGYLESQLANIILQADNNITLDMNGDTAALQNNISLTLDAGNDILTNSAGTIQTSGTGSVVFIAGNDINLTTAFNLDVTGAGSVDLTAINSITTSDINAGLNLTLIADDLTIGGNLSGGGTLIIRPYLGNRQININYGLDDGSNLHLDTTEISRIIDGWNQITIGRDSGMSGLSFYIGSSIWHDPITFISGRSFAVYGDVVVTDDALLRFITSWGNALTNFNGGSISTVGDIRFDAVVRPNSSGNIQSMNGDIFFNKGVVGAHNFFVEALNGTIHFSNGIRNGMSVVASANTITFGGALGHSGWATGSISLTATNSISLPMIRANSADITVTGAGNTITTSVIDVTNDLTLTSDDVMINGTLSGGGVLILQPYSTGRLMNINYGIDDGASFHLSTAEIENLVNGWNGITIGKHGLSGAGVMSIGSSTWYDPVEFTVGSNGINLRNAAALTGYDNAAFSFRTTGGNLVVFNGNITTNGGDITVNAPSRMHSQDIFLLSNGGDIRFNRIDGGSLGKTMNLDAGTGSIFFNAFVRGDNNIIASAQNITLSSDWGIDPQRLGNITLTAVNNINLPSISANTITVRTTGASSDIVLGSGAVLDADGVGDGVITLAAGQDFINNSGAGALVNPNGSWHIFSDNPTDIVKSGLVSDANRYGCTYNGAINCAAGTVVPVGENVFFYEHVPTLTITADDASRIYGNANPGFSYTVTGLLTGDTEGDALSGSLTTAANVTSNIGTYDIVQGELISEAGYALDFVKGTLSVTQRAITVDADAASRVYGNANPSFTYTIGGDGLVNGDTMSGALTTAATVTSDVGTYGITQGTLTAGGNYAITYTGDNMTITQRAITVNAHAIVRVYGNNNPTLTYTIGGAGLVNGDTMSGTLATAANNTSNVGTYGITQGTLDAGGNYAVTYTGNNLTVNQRNLVISAHNHVRMSGLNNPPLTYSVGGQGLVNGDTVNGSLATAANALSPIGEYAVTQGSVSASANYAVTFIAGRITVTPGIDLPTTVETGRKNGVTTPVQQEPVVSESVSLVTGSDINGPMYNVDITEETVDVNAVEEAVAASSSSQRVMRDFYKVFFTKELLSQLGYRTY